MESTETSSQSGPLGGPDLAATGGNAGDEVSGFPGGKPMTTPTAPWWVRIVPFFLSAFFFLSALFAIFAPLPLLFLRFRSGRSWAWVAVVTNSAIVGFAAGRLSLAIYSVFVSALAISMG